MKKKHKIVLRQITARAIGLEEPNPRLWGLARYYAGSEDKLLAELNKEKVAYLALPGLKEYGGFSPGLISKIESGKLNNIAYNVLLMKVYEDVSGILTQTNIPHFAIKGCDLLDDFYPDPSVRYLSDIDILVRYKDFDAVCVKLGEMGFNPMSCGKRLPGVWATRNFYKIIGHQTVMIDLHFCPGPPVGDRLLAVDRMFTELKGRKKLSPEYRALIIAVHHQSHFMSMPLIGYHEFFRLYRQCDLTKLKYLMKRWNVYGATQTILSQASFLFGVFVNVRKPLQNCMQYYLVRDELTRYVGRIGKLSPLIFLLSLDNPGTGIGFVLHLLMKKYASR